MSEVHSPRPMSDVLVQTSYVTPIGELRLVASDRGLCGLVFADSRGCEWLTRHTARWFPSWPTAEYSSPAPGLRQSHGLADHRRSLDAARSWLDEYFDDPRRADAASVPLDMRGAEFERRVWRALLKVRCGSTSTYGAIAKALGSPGAARAVGAANGANPVSLIVPCHRIIGSNGSLTGYGGGLHRKEWLLKHEGARLF